MIMINLVWQTKRAGLFLQKMQTFYVYIKLVFCIGVSFTHPNKAQLDIPYEF